MFSALIIVICHLLAQVTCQGSSKTDLPAGLAAYEKDAQWKSQILLEAQAKEAKFDSTEYVIRERTWQDEEDSLRMATGDYSADIKRISDSYKAFNHTRSNEFWDEDNKKKTFDYITKVYSELGLKVEKQDFTAYALNEKLSGTNIIGILPGQNRGTSKDKILVIGAHSDSVKFAPGVCDNGSGSTNILEVARIICRNRADFVTHTIMFIHFDLEELGLLGSRHFAQELAKNVTITKNINIDQFRGALTTDMAVTYDDSVDSQDFQFHEEEFPNRAEDLKKKGNRGNFVAIWARREHDEYIVSAIAEAWKSTSKYNLKLDKSIVLLRHDMELLGKDYAKQKDKPRFATASDHASFWYPGDPYNRQLSFPAVMFTDMGPSRGVQQQCYHQPCDDPTHLNKNAFRFQATVSELMARTALEIVKRDNAGFSLPRLDPSIAVDEHDLDPIPFDEQRSRSAAQANAHFFMVMVFPLSAFLLRNIF